MRIKGESAAPEHLFDGRQGAGHGTESARLAGRPEVFDGEACGLASDGLFIAEGRAEARCRAAFSNLSVLGRRPVSACPFGTGDRSVIRVFPVLSEWPEMTLCRNHTFPTERLAVMPPGFRLRE